MSSITIEKMRTKTGNLFSGMVGERNGKNKYVNPVSTAVIIVFFMISPDLFTFDSR